MDADSSSPGWLLFLAQLPSRPSSARVALWRRLRAAGATTMVNGAWVLPETDSHATFFDQLREVILGQGGTAFILNIPESAPEVDEAIVQRFQGDRAREYDEFTERCTAFLDEISKETHAGKYTFAEMEEGEQDLEKLARWLTKIRERDFFPDEHRQQSATMLARCRSVLDGFSQAVYIAEGVQEAADSATPDQAPLESSELSGRAGALVTSPQDLLITVRTVITTVCLRSDQDDHAVVRAGLSRRNFASRKYSVTCDVRAWQLISKVRRGSGIKTGQNANLQNSQMPAPGRATVMHREQHSVHPWRWIECSAGIGPHGAVAAIKAVRRVLRSLSPFRWHWA
jgi:hypothetical protein